MNRWTWCAGLLLCVGQAHATVVLPKRIDSSALQRCPGGQAWADQRAARGRPRPAPLTPAGQELMELGQREGSSKDPARDAADAAAAAADSAAAAAAASVDDSSDAAKAAAEAEAARRLALHEDRRRRLVEALDAFVARHGVPTQDSVGARGMDAMLEMLWSLADDPSSQARLGEAVLAAANDKPAWFFNRRVADIVDEALLSQGLPQRYGTVFEPDRDGAIEPALPIEPTGAVEARRSRLGLAPLALERCVRRESDSGAGVWMLD